MTRNRNVISQGRSNNRYFDSQNTNNNNISVTNRTKQSLEYDLDF